MKLYIIAAALICAIPLTISLTNKSQAETTNKKTALIEDNQYKIDSVIAINDSLQSIITELTHSIKIPVTATMYHPVVGQCDDTPDITGDQSKIPDIHNCTHLNWIAVSQDLLWFNGGPFRYGDKVLIMNAGHKDGLYTVRDAMNKRKKNKIDFLESVGSRQYKYKNVLVTRIDN